MNQQVQRGADSCQGPPRSQMVAKVNGNLANQSFRRAPSTSCSIELFSSLSLAKTGVSGASLLRTTQPPQEIKPPPTSGGAQTREIRVHHIEERSRNIEFTHLVFPYTPGVLERVKLL